MGQAGADGLNGLPGIPGQKGARGEVGESVRINCWVLLSEYFYHVSKILQTTCEDPEGGPGVRTPLKSHKTKGFLSNNGVDALKITKLPSKNFTLCYQRPASKTPLMAFPLRAHDDPFIVVFGSSFPPPHQLKKQKKNVVNVGPPQSKLSGSRHEQLMLRQNVRNKYLHLKFQHSRKISCLLRVIILFLKQFEG